MSHYHQHQQQASTSSPRRRQQQPQQQKQFHPSSHFTEEMRDRQARGKDPYQKERNFEARYSQQPYAKTERQRVARNILDQPELLMMQALMEGNPHLLRYRVLTKSPVTTTASPATATPATTTPTQSVPPEPIKTGFLGWRHESLTDSGVYPSPRPHGIGRGDGAGPAYQPCPAGPLGAPLSNHPAYQSVHATNDPKNPSLKTFNLAQFPLSFNGWVDGGCWDKGVLDKTENLAYKKLSILTHLSGRISPPQTTNFYEWHSE